MNITLLFSLVRAVPKQGRVLYCLFRDPRTPRAWKIGFGAAVAAILTPFINIPEVVPVLGEMETVALLLLAARVALARAPKNLVEEHEAAIAAGTSVFHDDLARAVDSANALRGR
ncbi:MAG: YkvA family protein [Candidatus Dormibacteria bacterium]